MKAKYWIFWNIALLGLFGFEISEAIKQHQTLSQCGLSKTLFIFVLGTVGTAIAFIWAKMEE